MGQELTELAARISFLDTWAKIEALSAKSGKGTLEVAGGLGFESLMPRRAQLAVRARDFPVLKEGAEIAIVTGSAAVDADMLPEVLRAAARSHELSIRLPDTENRVLQPLEPHPDVVRSDEEVVELIAPYPIELHFDGRRGISVRRNDFDARIITELGVSYRDPDLSVGGYMEFRGGTFETLGRPFSIERGSMRFDGTPSLNPEVLLVATHRPEAAGSSPVSVSVTGTLANPEIAFSSDACPGDTGAITYLISGQCVADDPDLAQESEDAQEAFAIGIAGSSVLTLLGTPPKVGGVTPRVGVESRGHGYDTRFKAGVGSESLVPKFMRKLVRRVYVQGAVSTGTYGESEVAQPEQEEYSFSRSLDFLIELYFPHNIVGSGSFATDRWGIDVVWEP
jgi:autotransporter translocation and assembly factor TamB